MNLTKLKEIVNTKKSEKIEGFSSKVMHTWTTTMFMGCKLQVMIHTLCEGNKPLPHGLAVQNIYAEMITGSKSSSAGEETDCYPYYTQKEYSSGQSGGC